MNSLITILGPTATGKTSVAAALAAQINGEIISADSRQVYRGMDLGTGKDLEDYIVGGTKIPYHLIDIEDPGEEYNVYRFQQDFIKAFKSINERQGVAIMCGGTGMYLEAIILGYDMRHAPENEALRHELSSKSDEELRHYLKSLKSLHNVTDTEDRERMIRAIEIDAHRNTSTETDPVLKNIRHHIFGIELPRKDVRARITSRLKQRLEEGMVDEVKALIESGVPAEKLEFYGLEYRFLTQYVRGQISYNDMFQRLNSAIHQFSKRQMTWFRRMEKRGVEINWIDGRSSMDKKLNDILKCINP